MVGDYKTHIVHLRVYKVMRILSVQITSMVPCTLTDSVKLTEYIYWLREYLDTSNHRHIKKQFYFSVISCLEALKHLFFYTQKHTHT